MYQDRPVVNPFLATLLVALILLSVVLSGIAFLGMAAKEPPPPPEPEPVIVRTVTEKDPEVARLRERVAALERKFESLGEPQTDAIEREVKKLQKDVSELSRRGSRRSSRSPVPIEGKKPPRILTEPERLALVKRYRERALDEGWKAIQRIQALKMLKAYGGRTTEVALSMFELFLRTEDPALRLQILQGLRGMEGSPIAQHLMDILRTDANTAVREEAAGSLRIFVGNPEIRLALEEVGRSDSSASVRQIAQDVLASPPPAGDGSD
jgi:hypothetical protein